MTIMAGSVPKLVALWLLFTIYSLSTKLHNKLHWLVLDHSLLSRKFFLHTTPPDCQCMVSILMNIYIIGDEVGLVQYLQCIQKVLRTLHFLQIL